MLFLIIIVPLVLSLVYSALPQEVQDKIRDWLKDTAKWAALCAVVVAVFIAMFALLPDALAAEYDIDAEVISIIYVDDIVEFDDGTNSFEFEGGSKDHRLGDILYVIMDNMDTPTRKDDVIVESEHIGETMRIETCYVVAVNNVAWGAFVFQVDAEEFVKELKAEGITSQLITIG